MRMYKKNAYLEPQEVVSLTGLTHEQLAKLTKDGVITAHVTVETQPDDLRYLAQDAVTLFQDLQEGNVASITSTPSIHNGSARKRLIRQLTRVGISLLPSGSLKPPKPAPKPKATPAPKPKAVSKPVAKPEPEPEPLVPDTLPFDFMVGDPKPARGMTPQDLKLVKGCFGFLDETNSECTKTCIFKEACGATRFKVLQALAARIDTPQEPDLSFVEQDYINLQDQLASLSFES